MKDNCIDNEKERKKMYIEHKEKSCTKCKHYKEQEGGGHKCKNPKSPYTEHWADFNCVCDAFERKERVAV